MIEITSIEFEGGPEDGRILSADLLRHALDPEEPERHDEIRFFLRPESPEAEPYHIGTYMRSRCERDRAVYTWQGREL